jgi:hypothetical protein
MQLLARSPGFEGVHRLALIRDADSDAGAAFSSAASALTAIGLDPPKAQLELSTGNPASLIYIMASPGSASGELEDICLAAISDQVAFECVEDFVRCSSDAGRPLPQKISKGRLHAYLALADPPGPPLSVAARANSIPLSAPAFEDLRTLLGMLCE